MYSRSLCKQQQQQQQRRRRNPPPRFYYCCCPKIRRQNQNHQWILLLLFISSSIIFTFILFMVNIQFVWLSSQWDEEEKKSPTNSFNPKSKTTTRSYSSSSVFQPSSSSKTITITNNILYIHIGKTGGEFLKSQLKGLCFTRKEKRLRTECYDKFNNNNNNINIEKKASVATTTTTEGALPYLSSFTTGYNHASTTILHSSSPQHNKNKNNDLYYTHVLFTIRHPITRFISWYKYNHPKSCDYRERQSPSCISSTRQWSKQFFIDCYPTIDSLATIIIPSTNTTSNMDDKDKDKDTTDHHDGNTDTTTTTKSSTSSSSYCSNIFWNGWYGRNIPSIKEPNHLYWNYHFYWNQTRSEIMKTHQRRTGDDNTPNLPKILIIRQESLKQDALQLEDYLSGKPETEQAGVVVVAAAAAGGGSSSTSSSDIIFFPSESQHYVKPWKQQQKQQQQQIRRPNNNNNINIQRQQQQQQNQRFPAIGVGVGSSSSGGNDNDDYYYGGLSKQQRRYLCECILWDEILIYQHLILHADNLVKKNNQQEEILSKLWIEGCGYNDIPTSTINKLTTRSMMIQEDDDNTTWTDILSTTTAPIRRQSSLCHHGGV